MHGTPLLLCVSSNPEILELRRRVLATRYNVVAVGTLEQMEALPRGSAFDLVILCHTLKKDECGRATKFAQQKWPGIKVLTITAPFSECEDLRADISVDSLANPTAMFAGITKLLAQQPHPGTGYETASQ